MSLIPGTLRPSIIEGEVYLLELTGSPDLYWLLYLIDKHNVMTIVHYPDGSSMEGFVEPIAHFDDFNRDDYLLTRLCYADNATTLFDLEEYEI